MTGDEFFEKYYGHFTLHVHRKTPVEFVKNNVNLSYVDEAEELFYNSNLLHEIVVTKERNKVPLNENETVHEILNNGGSVMFPFEKLSSR